MPSAIKVLVSISALVAALMVAAPPVPAQERRIPNSAAEVRHSYAPVVLPNGFHRIRHYGLFASSKRVENIARVRQLLVVPEPQTEPADATDGSDPHPCPHCGGRMIIIETFARDPMPWHRPTRPMMAIRIDTS
jgi:hypothetical protein